MSGEMQPYVVRQGDYLVKLAWVHGFDAEEVWAHAKNKALADLRKDHHVLAPGDVLFIPVKVKEGLPIRKGEVNRYVAQAPRVDVKLQLRVGDTALADEPYEVRGLTGPTASGTTDGEGKVSLKVPVSTREIEIVLPGKSISYRVRVGDLDPLAEDSGARMRLSNLGHGAAREGDRCQEETRAWGMRMFLRAAGLPETGEIDEATRAELGRGHGR
jgi:hypothetical protein